MDRFRSDLGPLAWLEDQWMRRNIWYCILLHFTTDVADPVGLIDWATAMRECAPISFDVTALELVRFYYSEFGPQVHSMRPQTWAEVRLMASQ